MRRYPDDRRLSAVGGRGGDAGTECVDQIADLLVRFHENAATGARIDAAATTDALAELWESSLDEIGPFAGSVLDPVLRDRVAADARRYLSGRSKLFDERIAGGRIRDGHGDLLADDVFCLDDGPRVLDCLEFDERLRFGDVLADVTFLAMDLERLGRPDLARRLLDRYREGSGDRWPASLEHFYIAYRALVRAKIACLRAVDDPAAPSEARALLALAAAHLASGRVRVVVIGGPPATGKSTVARAVGALTGWPVIRSDEVRKRLAGVEPSTPAGAALGRGLYTEPWSDRTYSALLEQARGELDRGQSVILDASWSTEARRVEVDELAGATVSELTSFVCNVAPAIADERAARRSGTRRRVRRVAGDRGRAARPLRAVAGRGRARHDRSSRTCCAPRVGATWDRRQSGVGTRHSTRVPWGEAGVIVALPPSTRARSERLVTPCPPSRWNVCAPTPSSSTTSTISSSAETVTLALVASACRATLASASRNGRDEIVGDRRVRRGCRRDRRSGRMARTPTRVRLRRQLPAPWCAGRPHLRPGLRG